MSARLPAECRCQIVHTVHNAVLAVDRDKTRHYAAEKARKALAEFIAHARVRDRAAEFHTEFVLDVYVFSPDEFWALVEREAYSVARALVGIAK